MKRVKTVSLLVLGMSVLVWAAGRLAGGLPDAAARGLGLVQLASMCLFAFSAVRSAKDRR